MVILFFSARERLCASTKSKQEPLSTIQVRLCTHGVAATWGGRFTHGVVPTSFDNNLALFWAARRAFSLLTGDFREILASRLMNGALRGVGIMFDDTTKRCTSGRDLENATLRDDALTVKHATHDGLESCLFLRAGRRDALLLRDSCLPWSFSRCGKGHSSPFLQPLGFFQNLHGRLCFMLHSRPFLHVPFKWKGHTFLRSGLLLLEFCLGVWELPRPFAVVLRS